MVLSKESAVAGERFEQSLKCLREETNAVLVDAILHTIAIVMIIIGILGGRVEVESQVGRGSTFRIWLPRDGSLTPERGRTEHTEHAEVAA